MRFTITVVDFAELRKEDEADWGLLTKTIATITGRVPRV